MTIRRISVFAALLAALSIAACANGDAAPTSVVASAPVPSATASKPSRGRPAPGDQTLSGTVTAGVEPNCLLLDDHLLIFDDPSMRAEAAVGTTVTVLGTAKPSMMTTCQQGTPFIVTSVR